jgi:hypothetical protein
MIEVEEDILTPGPPLPEDVMKKIKAGKFQTFATGKPDYKSLSIIHTIPFDLDNFQASYKAVKITIKEVEELQAKEKAASPDAKKK